MNRSLGAFSVFLGLSLFAGPVAAVEDCVRFPRLAPDFAAQLSLDVKKAKIAFTPLDLALDPKAGERPGYVLADLEGCSVKGDCDSLVYVGDAKGCYRSVLSFRGKWKGIDRKRGRELASLEVESRFESLKGRGPLGIERRRRHFEYSPKTSRYEETK
jgi:hypothetical protein